MKRPNALLFSVLFLEAPSGIAFLPGYRILSSTTTTTTTPATQTTGFIAQKSTIKIALTKIMSATAQQQPQDANHSDNEIATATAATDTKPQQQQQHKQSIDDWIVRPACLDDKTMVDELLWKSYSHLLRKDYDDAFLQVALPKITVARDELLTCGTWYVVEAPNNNNDNNETEKKLVGCGGFTLQSPTTTNTKDDDGSTDDVTATTAMETPHLRHFATDPDFARQGIASAIWKRTWKDLCDHYKYQQQPYPPAMDVYSTLTAESFYASLRFRTVKEISIPLGEDCLFPALLMKREAGDRQ